MSADFLWDENDTELMLRRGCGSEQMTKSVPPEFPTRPFFARPEWWRVLDHRE
jgi:hypothetical protein